MHFSNYRPNVSTPYQIAPWCYLEQDRIYHDFRGQFEPAKELAAVFKGMEWISAAYVEMKGFSEELWQDWIESTYLTPVINRWKGF